MICGLCNKTISYHTAEVNAHLEGRCGAIFCSHGVEAKRPLYGSSTCACCHNLLTENELKQVYVAGTSLLCGRCK